MLGQIENIDTTSRIGNNASESKFIVSSLKEFNKHDPASPYSIKIVTHGIERYTVNHRSFKLEANNYLIVNKSDELKVSIESKEDVKGICIYPPEKLIQEIFSYHTKSATELLDSYGTSQNNFNFTQKSNRLESTKTGHFLTRNIPFIVQQNMTGNAIDFNTFYRQVAECLVHDQLAIDQQLLNINSAKRKTKEELFRRVSIAKEYIQYNFSQKLSVDELAQMASLSKYHFLRVFKELFDCTPYQYMLRLKLNAAKKLMIKGYSYTQICDEVGFSDPKNLRKALKRYAAA